MFYSGKLSIDPSQITEIYRERPTKAFGRVLHMLTLGRSSPQEEQETFTAVSILQMLNRGLREVGITNIVRLAKDDIDFYEDDQGRQDDMREALDAFQFEVHGLESELFKTLILVAEHEVEGMKLLIEVDICRTHPVGEFPINIRVNGVPTDFQCHAGESAEEVRKRMDEALSTAEAYEQYVTTKQGIFEQFLNQLDLAVRKHLQVDRIERHHRLRVVRPKQVVSQGRERPAPQRTSPEPLLHGYYGFGDVLVSTMIWSHFMHDHGHPVSNVDLLDEGGNQILSVGENGFNADETDTLNPEADFEVPSEGDIEYHQGHDFQGAIEESGVLPSGDVGGGGFEGETESRSWLSDVFDPGDSGSSCGASCGSSCGGGCGGD